MIYWRALNQKEGHLHTMFICQNGRAAMLGRGFVLTGCAIICFLASMFVVLDSVWAAGENSEPQERVLTIGEVTIISGEVFSQGEIEEANPFLKFMQKGMNNLHILTRQNVLRRELLFRRGDQFNPELLDETERNLRNLGFLNNVFVVATDTTDAGLVNVEVRARDSWTLKVSAKYTLASNGDKRWNLSLSESNFLGMGTTLGAGVGATEISSFWNLWYRHRRMFGSRLWFGVDYSELEEGHVKKIFISQPFFAQSDPWSFDLIAWNNEFENRHYLSNAGSAGIDPASSVNLNALLLQHEKGFEGRFLIRAKGRSKGRLWRLGGGIRFVDRETYINPEGNILSDGRLVHLDYLLAPGEPLELVQGLTVFPYIWLQSKGRQWTKDSFVMQFGPVEDIPLGLVFDLKAGLRGDIVGSTGGCDSQFYSEMAISKWKPLLGGMSLFSGQARMATGGGNCTSHRSSFLGGWIGKTGSREAPWLSRVFLEVGYGKNLVGSDVFVLGLERGLRTLDFDGMAGNKLLRWNIEQGKAATWHPGGLIRVGGAVFYSGGLARFDDEERNLGEARHEIGVGLRMGPIRSANAQVGRLDVSWALDGSSGAVFTATTRGTF